MQFKILTLLTLAAVAVAVAVPGRGGSGGSVEDIAIKDFTEKCKSQGQTVICCSKISSGASKGDLTGNLNGADVTCRSVPSYVLAGNCEQTRAQCDGGLGCCSGEVLETGDVSGCSGFSV